MIDHNTVIMFPIVFFACLFIYKLVCKIFNMNGTPYLQLSVYNIAREEEES